MPAESGERQRFGRYETLFRIAGGGMAEVFAARALGEGGFQKLVALKRMRPELAEDARFVTMFLDEGRVAANIASPHVVSTLDLGRAEDNSLYLVMELVTGAPLSALMAGALSRSERIPVPLAVDIVAQAAAGLHAAHVARSPTGEPLEIVHRDCSPHNILVDVHGQVKITDFGIAKALERQTRSHAGEMKGKLQYLSPEQARGRPVDRRADIFILGVVAWEVLAGRQLFEADNPVEALHKVASMPIPRLDELVGGVSADVAAAVDQALQREPDQRFATAEAFGNALRNALDTRRPPASDVGALVRRLGGDALHTVERRIREVLGAEKSASIPPPSSAEHPIPLAVRSEGGLEDARSRAATVPSTPPPAMTSSPSSHPPSQGASAASPASQPPASHPPVASPASQPPASSVAPSRPRLATEPIPSGSAQSRPRLSTEALPSSPARPGRPRRKTAPWHGDAGVAAGSARMSSSEHPTQAPARRRRAGGKVAVFSFLVILAGGGGAFAAWWSTREAAPPEPTASPTAGLPEAPAGTDATDRNEPAPEPEQPIAERPPEPEDPPSTIRDTTTRDTATPDTTIQEGELASERPETASEDVPTRVATPRSERRRPRPRQRPRPRRPSPSGSGDPGTVGGSSTAPRGDRETAFTEIPWEDE